MKGKQGFTLLELLIAAAIIGVLAIFATQSFRRSAADIRVEDATVRAKLVLAAAKRFVQDQPANTTFQSVADEKPDMKVRDRTHCNSETLSVQNLINCGYLEYRQYVADGREGNKYKSNFYMEITANTSVKTVSVCIKGTSQKIKDYYSEHCETEYY